MEKILQGRRIIVTGGSSGMGAGLVRALPGLGAKLVSMGRNQAEGQRIVEAGGAIGFVAAEFADVAATQRGIEAAIAMLGGLDVLIHAAGVSPAGKPEETSLELWNDTMAVNATATFVTNNAVFPHLKKQGGAIINFASAVGLTGHPHKAAYAASKGAVVAWTRSIAVEWAQYKITANAIAPAIWTPMYEKTRSEMTPAALAEHDKHMSRALPLGGRLGDVDEDFVPVVAFLASVGARFITGQILPIDGGLLMMR